MSNKLERIRVEHYRSLLNVDVQLSDINILIGANGTGKSTLMDAILLIRDCWIVGVDNALTNRGQGIGLLWNGIEPSNRFSVTLDTDALTYRTDFAFASGSFNLRIGETLYSKNKHINLIERAIGSSEVKYFNYNNNDYFEVDLVNRNQLPITLYPPHLGAVEVWDFQNSIISTYFFYAMIANLPRLKQQGSESHTSTGLMTTCDNLWSVLRNLHDEHRINNRFDTILGFMREAFPAFLDLVIRQSSPISVYPEFREKHKNPIPAFHISDGYIQMLIHLTALFSSPQGTYSLIMFDEPETSLHPWAIAVFADAVKLATKEWNRQVIIATHSPVLMSQFESDQCLVAELGDKGQTEFKRVSEMPDMEDWLNQYALGSLFMSEAIAPQSKSHLGFQ